MKHIVCYHLLNDYSGSPKVLLLVLKGLLENNYQIDLYTSSGGALDELKSYKNLRKHTIPYQFSPNFHRTLVNFIFAQILTFIVSFRFIFSRNTIFYINTVLPCGGAIAGWLMRKPVVYHCHEYMLKKGRLYLILSAIMQRIATSIVCVSETQRKIIKRSHDVYIVHNGIPDPIFKRLSNLTTNAFEHKAVLMLASLKLYKGVAEFIKLAELLPQYKFILVINDTEQNIKLFFNKQQLNNHHNLEVFPRQADVVPFYNRSSIVLNLSDKRQFIETSGLTVIEAIVSGLPVIVPTVGGVSEMVTDGINGFKIDSSDLELISQRIDYLLTHREEYYILRDNAKSMRVQFQAKNVIDRIISLLDI